MVRACKALLQQPNHVSRYIYSRTRCAPTDTPVRRAHPTSTIH